MLIPAREAAEMIGTTVRTLRRWRLAGYGPAWERMGFPYRGQIRYPKKALQTWLRTERRAA